jgi:hypothetical protein
LRPLFGFAFGIFSVMNRFLTFAEGIPVAPPVQTDWTMTWLSVFGLAAALVAVSYGTRVGVIARATTKEAIRQPLFLLLLAISSIVLLLNSVMPFFTLEDDVKMLNECGLATLLISGALLAVGLQGPALPAKLKAKRR